MNNTKISIVWTDTRNPEYYFTPNWATKLPKYFKRNYEFSFFALTDTNSAIEKDDGNTIWLKSDYKTLTYGVTRFAEPDILIIIGKSNFNFENLFGKAKKKIFIHKGLEHRKQDYNLFDLVITEIESDRKHYKTSVCQPVVDTESYNFINIDKHFPAFFPQEISDKNYDFFDNVRLYGSIATNVSRGLKLPLKRHDLLNMIFNQSKVVSLLEDFDSFELALSALACNVPVVALSDTKASEIPVVLHAKKDEKNFINAQVRALKQNYDFRNDYILPNFTVEKIAGIIQSII